MAKLNLGHINKGIADRSNVFYWQTDRLVNPETAGQIWSDRHGYFTDEEIIEHANCELGKDELSVLEPFDHNAQTNLGNVNSVRVGRLASGQEVIVRLHPKGIRNGYFQVESLVAHQAKTAGLPTYDTLAIHDFTDGDDFAFQIIEKLPGIAITKWLESHPKDEPTLLQHIGRMMARIHEIRVSGFGPFDNEKANEAELIGLHRTFGESLRAGLQFNLQVLKKEGLLADKQIRAVTKLFEDSNPLVAATAHAVLVHNDFADWNLLTDGHVVTGILDWDECVASDPVSDIACWSTFFDPERITEFLAGYWSVAKRPDNFQEKFELLRLRYVISKMTLRLRRYTWSPTEEIREKIAYGKIHLAQSLGFFVID